MPRIVFELADGGEQAVDAACGYSLMEVAVDHGVPGIEGECGGSLTCSTCHCYVDPDWIERVGSPGADEQALLQFAWEPREHSRLSCQVDVSDALDGLRVRIPARQN